MASDQEVAQQILAAQQAGQLNNGAANELMTEQGLAADQIAAGRILALQQAQQNGELDAVAAQELADESGDIYAQPGAEMAPPDALAPNPPSAIDASGNFVLPPIAPPEAIPALQQANLNEQRKRANFDQQVFGDFQQPQVPAQAVEPEAVSAAPEMPAEAVEPVAPEAVQQDLQKHPILQGAKEAIVENKAVQLADRELKGEFLRQKEDLERQKAAIQQQIDAKDLNARTMSLPEIMRNGSWGQKIGAAISIAFGAISQGLSGAKSNPVLDFIERQTEAQAAKDKLSLENKLALKKALIDVTQMQLQNIEANSKDMFQREAAATEREKLAVMREQVEGEQRLKAEELFGKQKNAELQSQAERGAALTDTSMLSDEQRKRSVRLPDGTFKLAQVGADQVDASSKRRVPLENGLESIARLESLSKDLNRVTDLTQRAKISTEIKTLAGALREPVVGPGAMTPEEYARIVDTVGDPTKLFAIPALQHARLTQLKSKLGSDLKGEFRRIGIDLPKDKKEQLIDSMLDRAIKHEKKNAKK